MSKFPTLSKSHRRAITTSLALLDERLCDFEQIARGRALRSVFRDEVNRLSPSQKKNLLAEITRMRGILQELKDALDLETHVENLAQDIWARSAAFWEVLVETEVKYLRRYGDTPPGLARYLDPRIEALIEGLSNLSNIASGKRSSGAELPSVKPSRSNDERQEDAGTKEKQSRS